MTKPSISLILIEDNPGDAFLLQNMLQKIPSPLFEFIHVEYLEKAIHILSEQPVDCALLDLSLPDSYGIETLLSLQENLPQLPIVVLSGLYDEELAIHAVQQGAQDYLVKGQVSQEVVLRAVQYAIERKQLEIKLMQRSRELEVANQALNQHAIQLELANQELEAFSYTVSHDLSNPLTKIAGFASLLKIQHAEQLGDQGRHFVEKIEESTQQMNHLIRDLLQLSLATHVELKLKPVNLSDLAAEIALHLQEQQPDQKVDIKIQPDLIVQGDPDLLSVGLENLLGNAWKYSHKREQAQITFGTISQDTPKALSSPRQIPSHHRVFFIRDNGTGFDMKFASKLFAPFQRLHNSQDFEGTGIGLATVKRIIHHHHGSIWAHAEVDKGATFYFTLPNASAPLF